MYFRRVSGRLYIQLQGRGICQCPDRKYGADGTEFCYGELVSGDMLVSFVCAMQVQSFRKLKGSAYATTMCIGNLRTATELWCSYRLTKNPETGRKSLLYYGFIGIFISGAALGGVLTMVLAQKAIWISSGLLLIVFFMMFQKEEGYGRK